MKSRINPVLKLTLRLLLLSLLAAGLWAQSEAQQKHPSRTVALKFLRAGWVTPAARQRFEQEAEALARMKHPGVAQIHDAGTIDDAMGPLLLWVFNRIVADAPRHATAPT